MSILERFSEPVELPQIPQGPGVCIIQDQQGQVLQLAMAGNIRRRIGQLLDSGGTTCVHGPKVYAAQQQGTRIFVRWKLTPDYRRKKRRLMEELEPLWKRR